MVKFNRKLYDVWKAMGYRCYNPNHSNYKNYGGRGVTVCDEWRKGFSQFREWAIPLWAPGLEIDRIDNDGNYEPANCRFVSPKENARNRRDTVLNPALVREIRAWHWMGVKNYAEIGRRVGVSPQVVHNVIVGGQWED